MRGWTWWMACLLACNRGDETSKAPPAAPPVVPHDAAAVVVAPPDAPPPPAMKLVGCKPAELPPRLATATIGTIGHGSQGGYAYGLGGSLGAPDLSSAGGLAVDPGTGGFGTLGMGRVASRPEQSASAPFTLGPINVTGSLDKAIIRRYLKRNVNKLEYCFEKVVLAHPNLEGGGVVSVAFVVTPNGQVQDARAAGLDGELDNCVADVLRSIELPKPAGGEIVKVQTKFTYGPPAYSTRGAIVREEQPVRIADTTAWTPYAAAGNLVPAADATKAATAVSTALGAQLEKAGACWHDKTGSMRAMFRLDKTGTVKSVRAGGLGDRDAEACVEAAFAGAKVDAPAAEVACDLERGEPASWRVSLSGGYSVLELVGTTVQRDGKPIKSITSADRAKTTFAVVADSHAAAGSIAPVLALAGESAATIIAVRSDAGPPVWVAMARDGRAYDGDGEGQRPIIDTRGTLRVCVAGKAVDSLAALAASCAKSRCATVTLGIDRKAEMSALPDAAVAARAAGFDRLLLSFDAACPK